MTHEEKIKKAKEILTKYVQDAHKMVDDNARKKDAVSVISAYATELGRMCAAIEYVIKILEIK